MVLPTFTFWSHIMFFGFLIHKERMRKDTLQLNWNTSDQIRILSPELWMGPSETPSLRCGCRRSVCCCKSLLVACLDFPIWATGSPPEKPVGRRLKAPGVYRAHCFLLSSLGYGMGFSLASSFYFKDRRVPREQWELPAFRLHRAGTMASTHLHPSWVCFASLCSTARCVSPGCCLCLLPAKRWVPFQLWNSVILLAVGALFLLFAGLIQPRPQVPCNRIWQLHKAAVCWPDQPGVSGITS